MVNVAAAAIVKVAPVPAVPLLYVAARLAVVAVFAAGLALRPCSKRSTYCFVTAWSALDGSACRVRKPVIVSPALSTLLDAEPVTLPARFAVIVPAAKLPDASRTTTFDAVFVVAASTAQVVAAEPL